MENQNSETLFSVKSQEEITRKGNPAKPQGTEGVQMLRRMNESHGAVTQWALTFLKADGTDQILDIGCGGGAALKRLSALVPDGRFTGIDYSPVSVSLAKETNAEEIRRGITQILEASVEKLPFADESFDKVITVESFYFWRDPAENLKEVFRVLKTNGAFLLIADVYQKDGLGKETMKNIARYHMFNPTPEQFRELFEAAGFARTEIYTKEGTDWICVRGERK